ncbi:hypothetical protein K6M90_30145 [Rhizobium sp. 9T]|uniref:Uncharacterized protein n=4 Tax=Rhizobium TaxID=379 RepID=A0A1L5PBI4_RHIET|nr:hypothetical protein AM571_PB00244 [Rhizobium etli 8C-3]MBY4593558.1 hypothetical protein [Rhizobium redzepovicii]MBY4611870.1 hypothetical protein [Rhizobium croatiense]TCU19592.1 hypothetical protein EV130_11314 [Rhizobium azibense]MBY4618336.1 hypothetical protein [Rhizobium redzepovicii]
MVDRDPRTKGQGSSRPDEGRHPADQRAQSSVARVDQVADNFNSDDIWQENSVLRYVERLSVGQPSPPTELQSPEEQTPQMMADMTELTRVPVVPAETAFNLTRTTDEYNNADRTIHLVEGQPLETGPQRGGLHGLGNLEASAVAGPTEVPGGREEHSAMSEVPAEPSDPTGGGRKRRTTEKDADPRPSRRQTLYAQRPLALAPDLSAANAGIIVGPRAAFRTVSAQDQARLDEIARQTPRQSRQSKGAWADALKAAHPYLSAADAAVIVGVVKRVIARRAAYRTVSAQDRARLDEIKAATPQLPGQSKGAWADALKAAHPDLSAADAAITVGSFKDDIARRTAFRTVSAQDQARLDEIARQTPQLPGQSKGAWADALKAAHPDLSAADAAIIVGAVKQDIAKRAAFQTVSAQDQARLDEIAAVTPRLPGQSKGAWADALKAAHPDLSAADAAIIVNAVKQDIAKRTAFQTVSAQDHARLDEIARQTPQLPGQSKGAWADALKAAHPDLSAADAAAIVGAVKRVIARRAAFQTVSAQDQARLDEIARQTPRLPGQSKGAWADALKAAHPDLSASDAAIIVGSVKHNIAKRAAFRTVSAQDQARLDEIARQTPRQSRQSKGAWADALKAAHPDLSAADAATIVGALKDDIAVRAAFRTVSAQDQARLDEIAAVTPQLPGQSKGAWADTLKAAHPDLSAADAATIVGAAKDEIARRAAFRTVSAQDQARLDELARQTPQLPGQSKAAWADALKAAHPDLSAADAAVIVGAIKQDIAKRAAFRTVSAQDQARLDEIAAATPRQGGSNAAWADALKAAHPDLSAADAATILGTFRDDIARRAAFRTVSAQDQARLDEIARQTPQLPGQSKGAWADALKAAHPDLSAADAAIIVGASKKRIARRAAFKVI